MHNAGLSNGKATFSRSSEPVASAAAMDCTACTVANKPASSSRAAAASTFGPAALSLPLLLPTAAAGFAGALGLAALAALPVAYMTKECSLKAAISGKGLLHISIHACLILGSILLAGMLACCRKFRLATLSAAVTCVCTCMHHGAVL